MNITTIPRAVLRFQYRLVRLPLQVIEDRVVVRMGEEAPGRLFFEKSLGVLDATVGRVLGDSAVNNRGSAMADRADARARAARLDAAATAKQEHAETELEVKRAKVADDRRVAGDAKAREIERASDEADDRRRAAADEAEKRTAKAKQQAEQVAATRKSAVARAERADKQRIEADEKRASEDAKAKLADARAKRDEAQTKRARADRVEDLAGAEKRSRRTTDPKAATPAGGNRRR